MVTFLSLKCTLWLNKSSVSDKLFVRHWDRYIDPNRYNQLFVQKIDVETESIKLMGKAINLMKGTELETPVAPTGDENDYDVSPDGNN